MRTAAPLALVALGLGAACSGGASSGPPPRSNAAVRPSPTAGGPAPAPAAAPVGPPPAGLSRPYSSDSVFGETPAPLPYGAEEVYGGGGGAKAAAGDDKACPAGMKLVDGDYCTEVEHECARSWFDKSNKKTVCEEFKPTS